jgi:hypothetical protein
MRQSPWRNQLRAGRGRAADRRFCPDVGAAALEDRRLLSTVAVSTTQDVVDGTVTSTAALIQSPGSDGKISLREAVLAADNTSGSNEIDIPKGVYNLTSGVLKTWGQSPSATQTIKGAGSGQTTITNANDKVFSFDAIGGYAEDVILSGMTLTGHNFSQSNQFPDNEGGAFNFLGAESNLTMTDIVVTRSSTTDGDGGGIALFTSGLAKITDSAFTSNTAYSLANFDVQVTSWGSGSQVPTSGNKLVIVGFDGADLIHIRSFDASGLRTDTSETRDSSGTYQLMTTDAAGRILSDAFESDPQNAAIATLRQLIPGLLFPHVLTDAENVQLSSLVTSGLGHGPTAGTPSRGGGIYIGSSSATNAFLNPSTVAITNTSIENNSTAPNPLFSYQGTAGGGGGIYAVGGPATNLELHGVTVSGNVVGFDSLSQPTGTPVDGGGVYALSENLIIDQSSAITSNAATGRGGGLFTGALIAAVTDTVISENGTPPPPNVVEVALVANDVYAASGSLTIHNSVIGHTAPNLTVPGTLIDQAPGATVDASDNWLGQTQPNFFGAGVIWQPFLVADVTAPKSVLSPGESVPVTFSVTRNNLGLGGFHIPDGSLATFSGRHGTAKPFFVQTAGSAATAIFTADTGYTGPASVLVGLVGGFAGIGFTIGNQQAPAVTTQPLDQTVRAGQSVTFTAAASGVPTPMVRWQVSIDSGKTFTDIAGATYTSYTFAASAGDNGKLLRAVFTNPLGSTTTANARLTVSLASVTGVSMFWGNPARAVPLLTQADGLRLLPSGRSHDIPWMGFAQISINLDNPVALLPTDVKVTGIRVADYGPVAVLLSPGTTSTYTIIFRPIDGPDRVTLSVDNPTAVAFTRRLDVLPGDVNDDGAVTIADAIAVRDHLQSFGGVYLGWADVDGNGVVDLTDMNTVRKRIGQILP